MEYQPINENSNPNRKYKIIQIILAIFLLGSLVAISILTYELIKSKRANIESAKAPYDHTNDFPLKEAGPWDITKDHPREFTHSFDEGTWINIDMSPAGDEIIFDFLGDLYTLPYPQGGDATIFKSGVSFDVQPKYSPDGKNILFTSDANGCDNIWIKERNGNKETQITFEPYHWVSNAKWINESRIVGVKWYTSTRSIGAGEIWAYDVSSDGKSNPGTRFVGRSGVNFQVGPEEPFSSGNLVYYSKNTRDSSSFNYGKDPYSGIYTIYSYNIDTGASTRIAGGAGGAARPIASRKGDKLAFIRRYYLGTALVLLDLESGNEVIVYDHLDFDQQESSAPAGTYPNFAFTPDDSHIVIWAKGKIMDVNLSNGEAKEISFNVKTNLSLANTVRHNQNVTDRDDAFNFKTKVALTPHSSDNDSVIVFTSIGKTFIKFSESEPKPIDPDHNSTYQFTPFLNTAGNYLVHVVWDDQDLASIEIVSTIETNRRYTLPLPKGRYSFPSFSPNFNMIAYTRLSGDGQSGNLYSNDPGIYVISIETNPEKGFIFGNPKRVSSSGHRATFSSNGKSLFVLTGNYPLSVVEHSIEEKSFSKNLGVLAEGLYCSDISISPNKKRVAFIEFKRLYVQNFEYHDKTVNISAREGVKKQSTQTQIVSLEGAHHLTWTTDSSSIKFGWGPKFYSASASRIDGCKTMNCVRESLKVFDVSITSETGISNTEYYFYNATIVTMDDVLGIIENGAIVVKGDRIVDIGTDIQKPQDAIEINLNNGYVLPGFLDVHAHWDGSWGSDYKVKASWEFYVNLAYGVTTVHNPSADTLSVFSDSELVKSGRKLGPRIFSTGEILYGAGGNLHCEISDVEDALSYLTALKSVGAWSIKTYNQPCRQARQKLLHAANQLNMNIVPEGGMSYYWNLNQIIDGHTTIEHSIPMAPLYKDVITLFAQSGTAWTPTFIVNYGGVMGEEYWFQNEKVWQDPRANRFIPKSVIEPRTIRRLAIEDEDYHHFNTSRAVKQMSDAGGLVNTGAHGQMQGIGFHWEMKMFEQGGMSPLEVLKAATSNPAKSLGLFGDVGSLKKGKLADILIFDSKDDVINSVSAMRNVKHVVKDGRIYEALTMKQIYPVEKDADQLPVLNTPHI